MAADVVVRKVETKADLNTFIKFPWSVYQDFPLWVPPLVSMMRHKLDRDKNPTWDHLEGDYFVAWRGDRPVGTIAAFINHRHNEFQGEQIGFFGLFECYDDQEAAQALLDTAADYVAARGYRALRGPASFSTNDECGLLVEGFDDPPVLLYPYHPPYYQRLIERVAGFRPVMDLYSYYFSLTGAEDSGKLEKIFAITENNNRRRGITIRPARSADRQAEFTRVKEIYNRAWEKNWGFVPFSARELDAMVAELNKIFDPRMLFFAEVGGEPVAFILGLPDFNQVLHRAYPRPGKPEIISLLQILWHWKIRPKITRVRIMLMGVVEGHRGIGVEAALFKAAYEAGGQLGWPEADGGWVLETNVPTIRLVESMNGRLYKRHRFFERNLTAGQAESEIQPD